jgi:cell division septum initiation protein DivIVA
MAVEEPELERTTDQGIDGLFGSGMFDTVRRGFAPDQVAEYLKRVANGVLALETRLEETRNELVEARQERDDARADLASARHDPYEDVSDRVTELVRGFDHQVGQLERQAEVEADRVLEDVRAEAERIMTQAREEAERVRAEAREEAEETRMRAQAYEMESRIRADRIVAEAREEANRAESDLATMRDSTLESFRDIRRRTLSVLGEVQAVIENGEDRVVVVEAADELPTPEPPRMAPRPDL